MKRSVTSLPLHYGKAPQWLFQKMKRLSAAIAEMVILEFGPEVFLRRMADPTWFQAFGCVVGFDWHSSGLTTTLCGALKEGLGPVADELSLGICGGKAKRAIQTPLELEVYGNRWGRDVSDLVQMSRLCAKIDNTAVQDGYSLYHHTFIFTRKGEWAIIQQGMSGKERNARRYQWLSGEHLDVTLEPHTGITCDHQGPVLNLVARDSTGARESIVEFSREGPDAMTKTWQGISLAMPKRHYIDPSDLDEKRLVNAFRIIHEANPQTFRELMEIRGVGKRTLSALALVSELVYHEPPSFIDPARFSFAHGGKDGHPFPVDRYTYEGTIDFLKICLDKARIGDKDRLAAFKRLSRL
jgi:uncharacterized protein